LTPQSARQIGIHVTAFESIGTPVTPAAYAPLLPSGCCAPARPAYAPQPAYAPRQPAYSACVYAGTTGLQPASGGTPTCEQPTYAPPPRIIHRRSCRRSYTRGLARRHANGFLADARNLVSVLSRVQPRRQAIRVMVADSTLFAATASSHPAIQRARGDQKRALCACFGDKQQWLDQPTTSTWTWKNPWVKCPKVEMVAITHHRPDVRTEGSLRLGTE
jgi:hypothetical protein